MNLMLIWNRFLDVIFPPLCLACKTHLHAPEEKSFLLCVECQKQIEINSCFYCPECNRRLPAGRQILSNTKKPCHQKVKFILAAAMHYHNKVARELIHVLKYQKVRSAVQPLTKIVNIYVQKVIGSLSLIVGNSIIVPISLHITKEKERGFNQAVLVAQAVRQSLEVGLLKGVGLPEIESGNLARVKNTKSQTETKNYKERKENIAGCFKIKNPKVIAGKNILLVDDIFTSGATMREAVRVLKEAGAKKIIGFVIAKA